MVAPGGVNTRPGGDELPGSRLAARAVPAAPAHGAAQRAFLVDLGAAMAVAARPSENGSARG